MSVVESGPSVVADRYRIERVVGRGAMGEVLEVVELVSGNRLALKRPRADADPSDRGTRPNQPSAATFLRHEYLILSQLAHPNVVAVYDFGIANGTPYYTMELLRGAHPGSRGAMPWRDVCRMLVTLSEPLSLLHSRRLVHRDLSPRNVFVEANGTAKLIDFGAIASMNAHHRPIGTPSTMAPEVWRRDQLDGRTDVFGLGALGYHALTGRHAFPARSLPQLPVLWQAPPAPPSELVPDVPHALDQLILSMLSLDRHGRPQSVAEVMQRLLALDGLDLESSWVAPPAALATPILVGREKQLALAGGFVARTLAGRGQACVVFGAPGSGRTRLLEAVGQAAQDAGIRVVRASAGTLDDAPYELLRELTQALALDLDEAGRGEASIPLDPGLGEALDKLRSDAPLEGLSEAESGALVRAFVMFCEHYSKVAPLCLAVDDVERADAASARVLAQLARRAGSQRLLLAFAASSDKPETGSPVAMLLRQAVKIETTPLGANDTEALVRSVFGDVPNVARVARWVHRHAEGQPSVCTTLLEFLVSAGAARFVAGSWELQEELDELRLPGRGADKLELWLPGGAAGRELLDVLSLVNRPFPLELSAYVAALPDGHGASALDELVRAQLVLATSQGYAMRDYASLRWARERLDPARSSELHGALARAYAGHGLTHAIQVAYHLWRAGEREQADRVIERLQGSSQNGLRDLIWRPSGLAVPPEFLEELLAYRKQSGASPASLYPLRGALIALSIVSDIRFVRYGSETLAQLRFDVGLDRWDETDPSQPDAARALACLQLAAARRDGLPERERGLPPADAIVALVRIIAMLQSPGAFMQDVELLRTLSELIAPVRELSATTQLIADSIRLSHDATVIGDRCLPLRHKIWEATRPETAHPEIDAILRDAMHQLNAFHIALDYATEGRASALQYASHLEADPSYEAMGLQIRRLHALGIGRFDEAQRWRRQRELLAVRTERSDNHLRFARLRELQAAYQCSDMLELTRHVGSAEQAAERFAGWRPWAALGRGYLHLRADEPTVACDVLEAGLAELTPFSHSGWHNLAATLAEAKNEVRDYARARELCLTTLEGAAGLGIVLDSELRLRAALAHAEAGLGNPKAAAGAVDALLRDAERDIGAGSVVVGMVRETACQIALLGKDYNAFSVHLDTLGEVYAHHPGLRARHARWVRKGKDRFRKLLAVLEKANAAKDWSAHIARRIAEQTPEGGSEYLLSFVLDELKIDAGQLYRVDRDRRCELLACRPDTDEPSLMSAVERSLDNWWSSDEVQTADEESETATIVDSQGRHYVPLWLTNPARPDEVTGLLLLNCTADQLAKLSPAFVKAVAMHLEAVA